MTETVYMVKNDTNRPLEATLTWKDGTTVDLTGAAAKFHMRKGSALLIDKTATILAPPTSGKVQYNWAAGETNVTGVCEAEFEVTFGDGKIATFPAQGFLYIAFREEVA